jgi:hypothetical protein
MYTNRQLYLDAEGLAAKRAALIVDRSNDALNLPSVVRAGVWFLES